MTHSLNVPQPDSMSSSLAESKHVEPKIDETQGWVTVFGIILTVHHSVLH